MAKTKQTKKRKRRKRNLGIDQEIARKMMFEKECKTVISEKPIIHLGFFKKPLSEQEDNIIIEKMRKMLVFLFSENMILRIDKL